MRRLMSAGTYVVLIAAALPAQAQRPDSTAAADSADQRAPRLETITVTGVLQPIERLRLGFASDVVGIDRLRAEPRMHAAEALRRLPGAFIDEANGPGGPTIIRLRGGEEVFTQILMDGIQLNENGGFFDFMGFPLTNVDRIELARGPQSALYGSSAVSGVVQFITRQGTVGRPRFELTTEGGSATENGGAFRTTLTASGGGPRLRYSLGGGATYMRGIYDLPNDTWTQDGSLRLDANPSDRLALTGTFRFIGMESNLPVRDPGATRVPLDPNARNTRDRVAAGVRATLNPESRWEHQFGATTYRVDFLFEDTRDDVAATGMFPFFVFDASFTFEADLWRNKVDYMGTLRSDPDAPGRGVTFSYGAAWEREDLENVTAGEFGDGTLELDRWSGAAFGELQSRIGERVDLVVGARAEKYEDLATEVTPRASVVVQAVPGRFALRGAVGRAYKAPNLQEQFLDNPFIASNPDLQPETSVSWEVGGVLTDPDGRIHVDVTYFHQTFDNLIRSVDLGDGTGRQVNRNLGASEAEGIEFDLRVALSEPVVAGAAGTWVRTEIRDNTGLPTTEFPLGESLPFRPDVTGSAYLQFAVGPRLSAVVRGSYVGGQTVLTERFAGNRVALDSYTLATLAAQYRVHANLTFYSTVTNIFDATYQTAFDRVGSPLTAAFGARLSNE